MHKVKRIRKPEFNPTIADRVVSYFNPVKGKNRAIARMQLSMMGQFYTGASKSRRQTKEWNTKDSSPDEAVLWDMMSIRDRARDLMRNTGYARGAVLTHSTNTVGPGLRVNPNVDAAVLGLNDEQKHELETIMRREFNFFADSLESDIRQTLPFNYSNDQALMNTLVAGDTITVLSNVKKKHSPYTLAYQLIEADRLSNPGNAADTLEIIAGVEKTAQGAPVAYHISRHHPGDRRVIKQMKWDRIERFGKETGRLNVIHLFKPERPGQTRGISWLAPVIEPLKMLGRYTDAELMAAVIAGMFTVFVKTESGEGTDNFTDLSGETGAKSTDKDMKLGDGMVVDLLPGEEIQTADPNRPNTAFEPFVQAVLREVGVSLNIPFEVFVKHFTSSYTAARAALIEAWKFFSTQRTWFARMYCQPVYEALMDEAVAIGRVPAPGYFANPFIRMAYLRASWIGPPKGMINEKVETEAAKMRMESGLTTLNEETVALTGTEYMDKHPQRVREVKMRVADGLEEPVGAGATSVQVVEPDDDLAGRS